MPKNAQPRRSRRKGWSVAGIVLAPLIVGGLLARWSPVAVALAILLVLGLAIYVLVAKPLPAVGLRSRGSSFAAFGLAALLALGGGAAGAASSTESPSATANLAAPRGESAESQPTQTRKATPTPNPTTFETVVERVAIPFESTTVEDGNLDQGTTALVTPGQDGVTAITYRVTYVDGVETAREVVKEVVETEAVAEVTSVGTRVPPPPPPPPAPVTQQSGSGCHPSYSGVCVPFASDVDCAGGSGDGPAYVSGPLRVVGHDEYQLDRDGDGVACD